MGGSGYRVPRTSSPQDSSPLEIIEPSSDKTDGKFMLTAVSDFLQEKLKEINAHDYDAINRHKETIPNGKGWILTYPKRFAQDLTSVNQNHSGQVVPTIKLVKSICDANNVEVSSYHVSNMVLNAFKHYTGPKTHQKMLQHFFNKAKSLCIKPTIDPSGQTQYIDGDLSSSKRERMARNFSQIEDKIKKAMESPSLDKWKDILKK